MAKNRFHVFKNAGLWIGLALLSQGQVCIAQRAKIAPKANATDIPPPAVNQTYEAHCDDPQTISDCHARAREICKGDFTEIKEEETDKGKKGRSGVLKKPRSIAIPIGTTPGSKEKAVGTLRDMTFKCGKAPLDPHSP